MPLLRVGTQANAHRVQVRQLRDNMDAQSAGGHTRLCRSICRIMRREGGKVHRGFAWRSVMDSSSSVVPPGASLGPWARRAQLNQ